MFVSKFFLSLISIALISSNVDRSQDSIVITAKDVAVGLFSSQCLNHSLQCRYVSRQRSDLAAVGQGKTSATTLRAALISRPLYSSKFK